MGNIGRSVRSRLGACDRERPGQVERLGGRFRRLVYLQVSRPGSFVYRGVRNRMLTCVCLGLGTSVVDRVRWQGITSRMGWTMGAEGE